MKWGYNYIIIINKNGLLYISLLTSYLWNVCGCLPRPPTEIICQLLLLLLLLTHPKRKEKKKKIVMNGLGDNGW